MDYKDINDYELIYHIRDNKEEYKDILYKKYSTLIAKYAYEYYRKNSNIGIEFDDIYQEGLIALDTSLKDYDSDNSLFFTYTTVCIKREMERIIKKARRNKNMILSDSYSIYQSVSNRFDLSLEDVISNGDNDTEEGFLYNYYSEALNKFKYELEGDLSLIYELRLNGFNNREISNLLDLKYKRIDNSLATIKRELRRYLQKNVG